MLIVTIKFKSNEIKKISAIFLPFLNLKNTNFLVYPFLLIRPLPSKIPSCAPPPSYQFTSTLLRMKKQTKKFL